MIPGEKGRKSDASLLAGEFLNLGPAKNMSKQPFFEEKMSGLRMFLELRECKARSNSVSEGLKNKTPFFARDNGAEEAFSCCLMADKVIQ